MTKNTINTSEHYAAPEMKVIELNLNGSMMTIITGSNSVPDPEDEYDNGAY